MKDSSSVCSHISANLYEQQTFNKYLKTAHLSYVSQHHGLSFNFWFMQWAAVKLGSFHLGLSANYSSCVISCKAHKPQAKHFFRDALHIKLSSRMLWFVVLRAWLQFNKLNDVSDLTFVRDSDVEDQTYVWNSAKIYLAFFESALLNIRVKNLLISFY